MRGPAICRGKPVNGSARLERRPCEEMRRNAGSRGGRGHILVASVAWVERQLARAAGRHAACSDPYQARSALSWPTSPQLWRQAPGQAQGRLNLRELAFELD